MKVTICTVTETAKGLGLTPVIATVTRTAKGVSEQLRAISLEHC